MGIKETGLCGILAIALVLGGYPAWVDAQEAGFPAKPVTIIVPFPPGFLDLGARTISESLSKELKVPVIVENKPGGAGLVGATAFQNTIPDGHTLLAASGAAVISTVQLSKTPTFDPRKDLLPLAYLGDTPCVMAVGKNTPFNSFDEFVQYAKANPDETGVRATTGAVSVAASLEALGIKKVGIYAATPQEVTNFTVQYLTDKGFDVRRQESVSFGHASEGFRMSPWEVYGNVMKFYRRCPEVDAIFIAGGCFRTLEMLATLEKDIELPVVTTVPANMWHCLKIAGVKDPITGFGQLLENPR